MNKLLVAIPVAVAATALLYTSGVFDAEEPSVTSTVIESPRLEHTEPQPLIRETVVPQKSQRKIEPRPAPEPIVEAPLELHNSDSLATQAIVEMALELGPWIATDEIVRKWVLAIDNLSKGKLVSKYQPWAYSMERFSVGDTKMKLNPSNYQRAEPMLNAALAIPPEKLIRYYHNWLPLFEQAYDELGNTDTFSDRLPELLERINLVKALEITPQLERKSVMYTYTDRTLEDASDLEKLMWRLGPDNSLRVQEYARQLQAIL